MSNDSVDQLREWGHRIEQAAGRSLIVGDNGVLALATKAGHALWVEPIHEQTALIFTGSVGIADETMAADTLCALLAANRDPRWTGGGCIAAVPQTREVVYRLVWGPDEPHWTESVFADLLEAFADHVDALAVAIANREIEQILHTSSISAETAVRAPTITNLA